MQITPKYNKHLLKDAVLLLATPPPREGAKCARIWLVGVQRD